MASDVLLGSDTCDVLPDVVRSLSCFLLFLLFLSLNVTSELLPVDIRRS